MLQRFCGPVLAGLVVAASVGVGSVPASAAPGTAAIAVDGVTGQVIYERGADAPRYPASLTKMMTLYVLFEFLKQGKITYKTELVVTPHAAAQSPSKLGLKPGQTITTLDAIYALVTKSANDAAVTVAENLGGTEENFARMMTDRARAIGMSRSTFRNASGLPNPQQIVTARDLVTLAYHLQRDFPEYYGFFKTKVFTYRGRGIRNHNRLLFDYTGTDGIKTGYTRASGFNLVATMHRNNRHIIGVVLGGKTGRSRDAQMRAMVDRAFPKAVAYNASAPLPAWRGIRDASQTMVASVAPAAKPRRANPAPKQVAALVEPLPRVAAATAEMTAPAQPTAPKPAAVPAQKPFATASLAGGFTRASVAPQPEFLAPIQTMPMVNPTSPQAATAAATTFRKPIFHVQIGAFARPSDAEAKLTAVRAKANTALRNHPPVTLKVEQDGKEYYRARFANFSQDGAEKTCGQLKQISVNCIVMRAE